MPGAPPDTLDRPGRDREEVERPDSVQQTGRRQPFRPVRSVLEEVLGADPDADDEVASNGLTHGRHDLAREAQTILKAAPVVVRSPVHHRREEFVREHIAKEGQLHAVEPAPPGAKRRCGVGVHKLTDLGGREPVRDLPRPLIRHVGGADRRTPGGQGVHPAPPVHQLAGDERAVPVDLFGQALEMGNDRVVDVLNAPRSSGGARVHAGRPKRLHEPGAAFRFFHVVAEIAVGWMPARAEMRIVGCADDPILHQRGADPKRREQQREARMRAGPHHGSSTPTSACNDLSPAGAGGDRAARRAPRR